MQNMSKTVLITGASSGIGFELALLASAAGYNVIGVGRDTARLEAALKMIKAAGSAEITAVISDLSTSDGVTELLRHLGSRQIDILINNAGYGQYDALADATWSKQQGLLNLNILALTRLTEEILPQMLSRNSGRILNVGSIAGFYPGPLLATYYASKAYVNSFSQAIAEELRGTRVTLTLLCPGLTATGFVERGNLEGSNMLSLLPMQASEVARIGWEGMLSGKRMVVPGMQNSLTVFGSRFLSRPLAAWIMHRVNRKPVDKPA